MYQGLMKGSDGVAIREVSFPFKCVIEWEARLKFGGGRAGARKRRGAHSAR